MGAVSAGYAGDAVRGSRKDGRLRVASLTSLVAAPFAATSVLQKAGSLVIAMILMTVTYALLSMYYGLVYSSLQDFVRPRRRATAMAIYFLGMYACGGSFGPLLTGRLSDVLARRAALGMGSTAITEAHRAVGLQQAMLVIPILCVALALVLYAGSRAIMREDMTSENSRDVGLTLSAEESALASRR
jgi:MFS family permease